MKITVLKKSNSHGLRKYNFTELQVIITLLVVFTLPFLTAWLGYNNASKSENMPVSSMAIQSMKKQIEFQEIELSKSRKKVQLQIEALTTKIGGLQAELTRINALGQRVANLAKINKDEFDFSQRPGIGGQAPASEHIVGYSSSELFQGLDDFSAQLNDRAYQLEVLESVLLNKEISTERRISGRPITKGWISSYFGNRTDPFNGKPAWHEGMDFAGKEGAEVIATGAGVITWSSRRNNYGLFIEINHGGGITTRYAHNSELLVEVGDVVSKGQVIAKMGSEGRSTGPHVHYEILKNSRPMNPSKFVNRR
ncbi:MAG: peptidoglycan DD-metalloendopeptidase family protein [Gammaproteobacteria bacterium]|nr:peptidoglycan DD-metalloendopeptidase family protein [Gammaproteobacteria bacterium]